MAYPSLPVDYFRYRPQIIFRAVSSDISQFAFKRPVDSPTLTWNISRYLPTTTRGLTKNSKNFQGPLRQARDHIVCNPLEYWHRTPVSVFIRTYYVAVGLLTVSCPILNQFSLTNHFALKRSFSCHSERNISSLWRQMFFVPKPLFSTLCIELARERGDFKTKFSDHVFNGCNSATI